MTHGSTLRDVPLSYSGVVAAKRVRDEYDEKRVETGTTGKCFNGVLQAAQRMKGIREQEIAEEPQDGGQRGGRHRRGAGAYGIESVGGRRRLGDADRSSV